MDIIVVLPSKTLSPQSPLSPAKTRKYTLYIRYISNESFSFFLFPFVVFYLRAKIVLLSRLPKNNDPRFLIIFISSVWYWVSIVYQCPRIRSRQMRQWQSPQSYLLRWIGSVYELERENDGSWLSSEHRTKELFQQRPVWLSQRLQRYEQQWNFPTVSFPPPPPPLVNYTSVMLGVSLWLL